MVDLSIFDEDELEYIVSVIPRNRAIAYLQRNSKEFSKIKPGFRATALRDDQIFPLLYKELQNGNDFIVTFVANFLRNSLQEIDDAYQSKCQKHDETTALIYTLNNCYFRERLNVYFKLVNKEISQAEIDKLVAAMNILQESIRQQQLMKSDLAERQKQILLLERNINELDSDKEQLEKDTENLVSQNEELRAEIAQHTDRNEELKKLLDEIKTSLLHKESEIQKIAIENESLSSQLANQIERNHEYVQKIDKLEQELAERNSLQMRHVDYKDIWAVPQDVEKYYTPIEMEEFQELISYYIEDSGITEGRELLISYISRITFEGQPIVGNRQDCRFLVDCLSSIITNNKKQILNFSDGVMVGDIIDILNSDCRIIYLDNFIGNFNETVLYSLLEKYHNKIIVISAMFDRTFNYVGDEFLAFCNYFNISRLKYKLNIDFDPAGLEEKEYSPQMEILQNAPTASFNSILKEFNFSKGTRENLIINIETHDELIGILAFCVIPYLFDVRGINPFDSSEKLNIYCSKNRNRHLINQWFEHE